MDTRSDLAHPPAGQTTGRGHTMAVLLVMTALASLFCQLIALNITPLRGESGWFIGNSWQTEGAQAFIWPMITQAYNGHYTPLFFAAEFLQARWFGIDASWWFARQMIVLGLLGTAMYLMGRATLRMTRLGRRSSTAASLLLALGFIVQPTVLELATWPFMAAQLLCIACGAMSISCLIDALRTAGTRYVVTALAWGYAAMHLFGVGLTISVGVLGAALLLSWALRLGPRAWAAIAAFGALTLAHAAMMLRSTGAAAGEGLPLGDQLIRYGALCMGALQSGLRSLWANGRYPWANPDSFSTDAAYGYALMLALAATAALLVWRGRREKAPLPLLAGLLLALYTVSVMLNAGMIAYRLKGSADMAAIQPFLFGTRYVVFLAYYVYLLMPLVLVALARSLGPGLNLPLGISAGGALIASQVFFASVGTLWPTLAVPFAAQWAQVVSQAQTQIAQGGVVANRPLPELDQEFRSLLHTYRDPLEEALGCSGCAVFDTDRSATVEPP